jgi:type IV secretion system protein VirD4
MVSRQESARPLLTPGEVMQLPSDEEVVMVSGHSPLRAKKLRYFTDANFVARVLPPPALSAIGRYVDRPPSRPDDWSGIGLTPAAAPRIHDASQAMHAEGRSVPSYARVVGAENSSPAYVTNDLAVLDDDSSSEQTLWTSSRVDSRDQDGIPL